MESQLVVYSYDRPIGFELSASAAGSCQFAAARIDADRIVLTVPKELRPARVRYCWADSPVCTLFDRSGLSAGPFELRIQG